MASKYHIVDFNDHSSNLLRWWRAKFGQMGQETVEIDGKVMTIGGDPKVYILYIFVLLHRLK